jgi:hypothetical protein
VALELVAFLVKLDRAVERRLAFFERANDFLEALQRVLEAELFLLRGSVHGVGMTL